MALSTEFNIYLDPEAAQIVFDCGIPIFSIPVKVTHQAIFNHHALRFLLDPSQDPFPKRNDVLPQTRSQLRHTLYTLLSFLAQKYKEFLGYKDGPPVHNALVVAYIAKPYIFKEELCRIDVELSDRRERGAIIVESDQSTSEAIKNAEMAISIDVRRSRVGQPA